MGTMEWPLVLFTVLGETAIGIIFVLWWLDRAEVDPIFYKKAALLSGLLLALALIASLFHLGRPEYAYRAVSHLSTSWLSREILCFLFAAVAWLYFYSQVRQPKGKRRLAAGITSTFGLLGIFSSSMIYVLPRVPAWDSVQTPLFFLLTTGLLGGLTCLVLGRKTLKLSQLQELLLIVFTCVLVSILSFAIYLSMLNTAGMEGMSTVQFLLASPLFWLRVVANWLLPLILLVTYFSKQKTINANLVIMLFIACSIGELLGRALFYLSAVGISITALK
ncbi:DmsC/YnfH family molybdoenzyme membrane anchor subunit [Desulfosporosinus sp. FKB]|uniref:dimethyl sulfoxide reductase anchor subunit family protein n=1 Tax=Desulfosporosinus sp. FKB TaxID=1969835 RepID=UPI000B49DC52|nr:DmsC/YnfH family molybdoenzyme membrane anchor subunit [Desulfosporosinus sp. FKB]